MTILAQNSKLNATSTHQFYHLRCLASRPLCKAVSNQTPRQFGSKNLVNPPITLLSGRVLPVEIVEIEVNVPNFVSRYVTIV
ncbi:hypothetical protein Y032_0365g3595 [Ancylostoma ceylanicum]|uniref:Uncharacterized protein n=1 Tax=Ancylostoma ceylanicum TaxID=53326 RepID=A0A016RUX8_9BILA|nr:hypothetical protein Y032_0365g3595 [Ancylostoma ceylanicum]